MCGGSVMCLLIFEPLNLLNKHIIFRKNLGLLGLFRWTTAFSKHGLPVKSSRASNLAESQVSLFFIL